MTMSTDKIFSLREFQRVGRNMARAATAYRRARLNLRRTKTAIAYQQFVQADLVYMNALKEMMQFCENGEFHRRTQAK
jgi:hypothetical protein